MLKHLFFFQKKTKTILYPNFQQVHCVHVNCLVHQLKFLKQIFNDFLKNRIFRKLTTDNFVKILGA